MLGKYAHARFRKGVTPDYDQKTSEFNLNYLIRQFDARVMIFVKDTTYTAVQTDDIQIGVRPADSDVGPSTQEPNQ